jgi:replicative superfamily II helicase
LRYVVATYEHRRSTVAIAEYPIFPNTRRAQNTYRKAIKVVVIDDVYMLVSHRGPVVSAYDALMREMLD